MTEEIVSITALSLLVKIRESNQKTSTVQPVKPVSRTRRTQIAIPGMIIAMANTAITKSKKIKKQDYGNNADVKMKIMYPKGVGCKASVYKFKVSSDKILFVIDQDHFEMVK